MTRYVCTLMFLLVTFNVTYSQADTDFWNPSLREIADASSQSGWIVFRSDVSIPPLGLFQDYKDAFGLSTDDEMILKSSHVDELGINHYFFRQYYRGVPIEDGKYVVHEKEGRTYRANGIIVTNSNMDVTPTISENTALQTALALFPSRVFAWEDSSYVAFIKEISIDSTAPSVCTPPTGELILTLRSDTTGESPYGVDFGPNNYSLSYKFKIRTLQEENLVYIDAKDGSLIKQVDNTRFSNCHNGTVETWYNNQRTFTTKRVQVVNFRLIDECRHYSTFLYDGEPIQNPQDIPIDDDNNWSSVAERPATSAHWAGKRCFDYFDQVHSRPGMDANYYGISIISNYTFSSGNNIQSAWWDPGIYCGTGDGTTAWHLVSINIIGHEWTHGVIQFTAELGGSGESGALEESFCDIFSEAIEFAYVGGDWLWAGEVFEKYTPGGKIAGRSFSNPKDPDLFTPGVDTYGSTLWNSMTDIHQRAGVQNKFFYLLCQGGEGTNDITNTYCVDGIGIVKSRGLAYKVIADELYGFGTNATFDGARTAWINAAIDYYGTNSNEVAQVAHAWYAVGVGPPFSGSIVYNNLTVAAPQTISHNGEVVFNNLQITPAGDLTATSNTRIIVNPTSNAVSGSYLHLYIDPACP